ncbi:MAG: SH3 domain-containing protein [Bacteroidota bacterium]
MIIVGCGTDASTVQREQTTTPAPTSESSADTTTATGPTTSDGQKAELPKWPATDQSKEGQLYPFDQAGEDASFVAFRQMFYQAVKNKDVNTLLENTSDQVMWSFGDDAGKQSFIEEWKLDKSPEQSELWSLLSKALELGGGWTNDRTFFAPYLFVTDKIMEAFDEAAIIGENVRLRDQPGLNGKIIGSLSWAHVNLGVIEPEYEDEINGEKYYWYPVSTRAGEKGFVYGKYVRMSIDYRAGFSKNKAGDWEMTVFIAGD